MGYEKDKVIQGVYNTSDIDLVAALSLYHPIQGVERSRVNAMRAVFAFNATDELMEDVQMFRDGTMAVEPRAYYYRLRDVRSQINDLVDRKK